jgi:hypothetical protein
MTKKIGILLVALVFSLGAGLTLDTLIVRLTPHDTLVMAVPATPLPPIVEFSGGHGG